MTALLLRNGRVWTGRPADDDAEVGAVLVANGRVVGTGDDALRSAAVDTQVVDLDGRRVVPGLIDSHLHAVRAGNSYLVELDWTDVRSVAEALGSIERAAVERPPGAWIPVLGGWHPSQFTERRAPTRAELDTAAPRHPVFVNPIYGHDDVAVLNSAGLAAMGWQDGCPHPDGGQLHRHPGGGLTGGLTGIPLYTRIGRAALVADRDLEDRSTVAFFRRLASLGISGVVDAGGMGMSPERYRAVREVWRRGQLPIRVRTLHGAVTAGQELTEMAGWLRFLAPGLGDDMLSVLGAGEAVHYGCHDWEGMEPFEVGESSWAELVGIARRCAEAGWPLAVHAILDSSATRILDAFEVVAADHDLESLRFSLHHVECISDDNLERVARLGIGLAIQGRMAQKAATAASRWGEAALRRAPPLGAIRRLGIPYGAGTDGTRSASYNPWLTIWWLVTGGVADRGPRRADEHLLSVAEALRAYTSGSAWFSFEEHRRGTLSPGMLADIAVLSEDPFAIDVDAIPHLRADLTIVGGRVAFASSSFAGLAPEPNEPRPGPTSSR